MTIDRLSLESKQRNTDKRHPLGLTKKEQEVLTLIVRGCCNKEISSILAISTRTAENHVASILKKFNVNSRIKVLLKVKGEPCLMNEDHELEESSR